MKKLIPFAFLFATLLLTSCQKEYGYYSSSRLKVVVDLTDAIMIVYHSLGQQQEGFNKAAADVNSDGDVDLTDAIIVVYQSLRAE